MSKRVFIYTEASPVHRDVVAHGLNRAAPPILRSVVDRIAGIAIFPVGQWFEGNELDPDLAHLCTTLPRLATLFCKAMRRYPSFDPGISKWLPPYLLAPYVRRSSADTVLSFVGANVGNLTRGARLAALAGKSHAAYLVDDLIAPLRQSGATHRIVSRAIDEARVALSGASHIFTITDGLGDHIWKNYGVSSTTLPLAFEPNARPAAPLKNQIIFVGSVNFLYTDGLLELFKTVDRVRGETNIDLMVRLTVPPHIAGKELGELPPFVISAPIETSDGLAHEIASSLFAFLPYSFGAEQTAMVATSFPSKSMEYLAYARSIVVYGPEYGTSTRCFREMRLPAVASSRAELEELTRAHLRESPEYSVIYRRYLAEAHSLSASKSAICAALDHMALR